MAPGVSIVIPTWNGLELLKRFLPSVIAAAIRYGNRFDVPTEILIVDDGSADKSAEWLLSRGFEEPEEQRRGRAGKQKSVGPHLSAPTLKLIRNEKNRGFGPTCNRGFEAASNRLVFLLNNDVEVEADAIAPLAENFSDDSIFAVHCRVFDVESGREVGTGKLGSFSHGFIRVHRSYVCLGDPAAESGERGALYSMFASGGSAMFDRQRFLEIGKFDSLLAPFYWEDVDISYRAWKRGLAVLYEPRSVVRHRVSSTMRKVGRSELRQMQQGNRLIYHWINLHDRRLLISHLMWLALLALTAPFRLRPGFLLSLVSALKKLPEIRKRRQEERQAARRSDREVFDIFAMLETRTGVFAYDDYAELQVISKTAASAS
jgi:GT2 family glycosyltransferase